MRNILIAGFAAAAAIAGPAHAVIVEAVTVGENDIFATGTPGQLTADFNFFTDEQDAGSGLVAEPGDEAGVAFSSTTNLLLPAESGVVRALTFYLSDGATWTSIGSLGGPATATILAGGSQLLVRFAAGTSVITLGDVGSGGDNFRYNANGAEQYGFRVGITAVPEPATWALMIGGFGIVGASLRHRRPALRA